ncbi:hypothetical protein [Achromobacter xylosoxidans]|uniref:hypothetical protein n=1 Tax=Alcaligenes xylosoxydans xylosoxydans TaxID=85698 RepID=UPI0006C03AAB|nr:hypothetical protein [Achromobacter xylosoxidans]QQE57345.1 hypothetical protein I6H41_31495 [Achromobacter xylosoxidans]QQV16984.1 hypothetical protein I6I48_14435 [Achromobacter xylosoxidans]CUI50431.1 Uncharacterised protein [Achromobacter xylosoxidans]
MAMNGSFAGGLADGLRNGMAIAQAYDVSKDRAREREEADRQKRVNREIAAAMGGTRDQLQAPAGLEPVQGPQAVAAGDAMGGGPGLQPVATSAPVAPAMATAQSLGLADVSTGGAGLGATQAGLPSAGQSAAMAQKKSPSPVDYLGAGDFGEVADGLTRAYRKALELGEPGRAMELLADREKYVGQHREQAFAAAQGRYQLTGDPNAYVPFVNRFMPGGIEVKAINRRSEQAGGAPVYDFVGVDTVTGKPVQQPITENMLQTFVRSISDPKAQQAMVAQQAKLLFDAEQKRREQVLASQLRKDEEAAKPRILGKDQTLYTPDGQGGLRVGAQGSEAGKPRMTTSDKDFANHVMRIFKVDSLDGLGDDQRKLVSGIIATGENINRLNAGTPAGEVLTAGNLAALAQQVQDGTAEITPIRLGDRQFGFGVEHEGQLVRLPVSVVPKAVQEQIRARLVAAPAQGGGQAAQAAAAPGDASLPAQGAPTVARPAPAGRAAPATVTPAAAAADSAEGAQLDTARAELRQAQALVRQLRSSPPGLKAGQETRARHAAQLQQAERDVELARVAEQAAAERWARATEGSEFTRAAMGRTTAE